MVQLQFATSNGFGSKLIRWWTWSDFSHVDLVLPDGTLLGARKNGGVQIRQPGYEKFTKVAVYNVPGAPTTVYDIAKTQVGKPYDWLSILNMGLHRNWRETDSWFCSELIAWAFEQAGFPLLNPEIDKRRITPRDLTASPKLVLIQ